MRKAICYVIFLSIPLASIAQEKSIHEIHAAMIFNIVKYIQWPNEVGGGEFVVGVMGDDQVFNTFKTWYDGKPKGTKKYLVKKLATAADAATCSAVYLGKGKSNEFENLKNAIIGKSVLTITDSNNLGHKGSCINFKMENDKLRFELNQAAMEVSKLKVSSSLATIAILI